MVSHLCRSGINAYLSLGNKKGVDIIATTDKGAVSIVEVKGVNKRNDWLISSSGTFPVKPHLFYALVCFNGSINNLTACADFWVIPSTVLEKDTEHKIAKNEKTVYISNKYIRETYDQYKNNILALQSYLKNY